MKFNRLLTIIIICCINNFNSMAQNNLWHAFPSGVPDNSNRYIYVDNQDVKWIGSFFNGLNRFKNGNWTSYNTSNSGIADNDVRQSCFDTSGNLWVSTWNQLSKLDTASGLFTNYNVTGQSLDILYSLQVDNQNRIWVGTDGGADPDDGLYMFDGTSWTFYNPINSALSGKWIMQLKKDLTGKIWGCHYEGFFEISDTTIINHPLQAAGFPPNCGSSCVDFDSYNNKWVGIYNGGLGKFDGTNWTIYDTINSSLPELKIWSIAVDQNNVVWIGTENKGLVRFDGTNWTVYNTSNSILTSNRIDALAIDKLNNLWIGSTFGGIVVYNSQGLSGISGIVYHDKNSNGIKDVNEILLPNQIIGIDSTGFAAITDASGNYYCSILNAGSYTARVITNSPYITNTSPDSINFAISNSAVNLTSQNFGITMTPNIHDNAIDITSLNAPRPGFSYTCNISAKNIGSLLSNNINVILNYDPNLIFDSTSFPFQSHIGGSIFWHVDSLQLFEQKNIAVYFHVPANPGLLGIILNCSASVYDQNIDLDLTNNSAGLNDVVIGSYDPNDKAVTPSGVGISGNISPNTDELTFTIRFQNTGTASAINIVIKDTLSQFVDLTSLQMIASSHLYSAEIKNGGIIWWHFNNINLPDSGSNEPGSHGFIKYKVRLKNNLADGTSINNTAYIFFDFNPAIITNQTINTIDYSLSGISESDNTSNHLVLYPNPASQILNFAFTKSPGSIYTLNIFDALGRLQFTKENTDSNIGQVDVSDFIPGIYFVQLKENGKTICRKFLKR